MTLASNAIVASIGIAIGIAIGVGAGLAILASVAPGLEKQVQEQNSRITALESELQLANEKNAALENGLDRGRSMQSMNSAASVTVPPVMGFYSGQEILFIHTEASDQSVASMLTMMMGSPVIFVPSLKDVPLSSLGEVYVFTNGVAGNGPFGFQPDVFSSVPTDRDYTPLRTVKLVSWNDPSAARELHSVEEVKDAEAKGEMTVSNPGVVVNMPIVKWQGGRR